jgi:uncharacterized membrane protein
VSRPTDGRTRDRAYAARAFERRIGRLLIAVTYVAVALLLAGVALMAINGISPLDGGPGLDLGSLPANILALAPAGFLWLGLLAVIATPLSRVVAAAIGFGRAGDRSMVIVAVGILVVIALGVSSALVAGG